MCAGTRDVGVLLVDSENRVLRPAPVGNQAGRDPGQPAAGLRSSTPRPAALGPGLQNARGTRTIPHHEIASAGTSRLINCPRFAGTPEMQSETIYMPGVDAPVEQHIVQQVTELQVGEDIQAWHNGKIYHDGTVLRTLPSLGLIVIRTSGGAEVLLDAHVLRIRRLTSPVKRKMTKHPLQNTNSRKRASLKDRSTLSPTNGSLQLEPR